VKWQNKALAFRVLSAVPFGAAAHFWLQRRVTKAWPRSDADLAALLVWTRYVIEAFAAHDSKPLAACTFVEIGAGRDLAVPIALRLLGVGRIYTIDISRISRLELVNHAAAVLCRLLAKDLVQFRTWGDLAAFGVHYAAPSSIADAPDGVDCFFSNEVFEHIPKESVRIALQDAAAHLKPGGLSIHAIDYSDHYARGGATSRYNFLRYDEAGWAPNNSAFQYVNRLRHSEYLTLFREAGFEMVGEEVRSDTIPADVAANLAPQFKAFAAADLNILNARLVARRKDAAA
jgi:hypothetical protein